jgi:hypothetical protein
VGIVYSLPKVSIHNALFLNPFPRGREIFIKRAAPSYTLALLPHPLVVPLSVAERGTFYNILSLWQRACPDVNRGRLRGF